MSDFSGELVADATLDDAYTNRAAGVTAPLGRI